jgi:hypothetical protein
MANGEGSFGEAAAGRRRFPLASDALEGRRWYFRQPKQLKAGKAAAAESEITQLIAWVISDPASRVGMGPWLIG